MRAQPGLLIDSALRNFIDYILTVAHDYEFNDSPSRAPTQNCKKNMTKIEQLAIHQILTRDEITRSCDQKGVRCLHVSASRGQRTRQLEREEQYLFGFINMRANCVKTVLLCTNTRVVSRYTPEKVIDEIILSSQSRLSGFQPLVWFQKSLRLRCASFEPTIRAQTL
jgi:hypothetical protein